VTGDASDISALREELGYALERICELEDRCAVLEGQDHSETVRALERIAAMLQPEPAGVHAKTRGDHLRVVKGGLR
jgi:hypothetical protein